MNFKHLTPADYPRLKPFFKNQQYRLSVYALTSIIAWSTEIYQPFGAADGDALFVYGDHADSRKRHLILPVSPEREFTPSELHALAEKLDCPRYWFVPEEYLARYSREAVAAYFTVEPQEGFHDYIYLRRDLAGLKGNKYAKKRNLIHQFQREYADKGRVRVEAITPRDTAECLDFLEKWCAERECDLDTDEDLLCERQALINTLEHMDVLESRGLLLRIDDEVSALGMASRLTDAMGVFNFEKAFARVKGLYQYFDNQCACRLFNGYPYINKESDMALPGLAKAKKSYHPVQMVRSYQLRVKKA